MKKAFPLGLLLSLILVLVPVLASGPHTFVYDDITADGWYVLDPGADWWDLTQCDLEISYTLDMSMYVPPWGESQCSAVGVGDGTWALLNHCAPYAEQTDPNLLELDDKLNLIFTSGSPPCWDEYCYDAIGPETIVTPPIGDPGSNFAIWFDRDGVDANQASLWGAIDGVTYNTGGIYDVVLTYHAIDATQGTLFATINGQAQGFYDSWWNGPPHHWPVGRSFYGNLTTLRAVANIVGGMQVTNLQITGCRFRTQVQIDVKPRYTANTVNLQSLVPLPAVVFTTAEFDATTINPGTVWMADAAPFRAVMGDVNGDGNNDMTFYFRIQDLNVTLDTTRVTLIGETYGGELIAGTDRVNVVNPGRP